MGKCYRKYLIERAKYTPCSNYFNFMSALELVRANFEDSKPLQSVYVMQNEEGYVKIGISCDTYQREKQLKTGYSKEINTLYERKTKIPAYKVETKLHNLFKDCRTSGEWFLCDPQVVIEELKKYEETDESFSKTKRYCDGNEKNRFVEMLKVLYGEDNVKYICAVNDFNNEIKDENPIILTQIMDKLRKNITNAKENTLLMAYEMAYCNSLLSSQIAITK